MISKRALANFLFKGLRTGSDKEPSSSRQIMHFGTGSETIEESEMEESDFNILLLI
jgi:hypothetical protein